MSVTPRTPREAVADESAKYHAIRENFATLYTTGMERVADFQKRGIDTALQHNKDTFEFWKLVTAKLPWAPRLEMLEQANGLLERFAETQKTAIDMAVEQTRAFADLAKDRQVAAGKGADQLVDFAQKSFDRSVAAQKRAVKSTLTETRSAMENAREHFGFPGGKVVADSIQKGVDAIIEAQKEVLETVAG